MRHGQNVKHYKQKVYVQLHRVNYDYNVKLLTLTVVQHKRSHLTRFSGLAHDVTMDTLLAISRARFATAEVQNNIDKLNACPDLTREHHLSRKAWCSEQ